MVQTRINFANFRAGEVSEITGISPVLQRNWRRRGLLEKKGEGWSSFSLEELVTLYVASVLIDRGVSASSALNVAQAGHFNLLTHIAKRSTEFAPDLPKDKRKTWADKLPEKYKDRFRRFLVIPDVGNAVGKELVQCDDVSKAIDQLVEKKITTGAVIVLDLETLADQIVERAGRPLMRVEVADDE